MWSALVGTLFALIAVLAPSVLRGQTSGIPAEISVDPTDIFTQFQLPSYEDSPGTRVGDLATPLRAVRRARVLGLTSKSVVAAWNGAAAMLRSATPEIAVSDPPLASVVFSGSAASALNQVVAQSSVSTIRVVSPSLLIDTPIQIQRSGLTLDLGRTQMIGANPQPYMVRIENVSNVTVNGGRFESGDSAILVNGSYGVLIEDAVIAGLRGAGIIVTGSTHVTIENNHVSGVGLCGIMIHRGSSQAVVRNNAITGGKGFSNMMAGIVVTDREVDLSSNPRAILGPDGYWVVQQDISQLLHPPSDILLVANRVINGVT
jgi:parallel beta-helix repeat protein